MVSQTSIEVACPNNSQFLSSAIDFTLNQLENDDDDALSFTGSLLEDKDFMIEMHNSVSKLESEMDALIAGEDSEADLTKIMADFEPLADFALDDKDDEMFLEKASEHLLGCVTKQFGSDRKTNSILLSAPVSQLPRRSNVVTPIDDMLKKLDASMQRTAQSRSLLLSSKSLPSFKRSLCTSQNGMLAMRKELFRGKTMSRRRSSLVLGEPKSARRRSIKRRLSNLVVKRRLSQIVAEKSLKTISPKSTLLGKNLNAYGYSSSGISKKTTNAGIVPLKSSYQRKTNTGQTYVLNSWSNNKSSIGSFLQQSKKW